MTTPELPATVAKVSARFTELVRAMPAPQARVDEQWSCADVAAHVGVVVGSYARYLCGDRTPVLDYRNLADSNAQTLRMVPSRDPARLAATIDEATAELLNGIAARDLAEPMPWHGLFLPIRAVCGICLAELLVHGRDIARANHMSWPIPAREATFALDGAIAASPYFVDARHADGVSAVYRLHLRGAGDYAFHFDRGQLTVDGDSRPGVRADCRISAAAPAMLLVVYHRTSQWRYIATGRLVATGRRPWLGLRFAGLFSGFDVAWCHRHSARVEWRLALETPLGRRVLCWRDWRQWLGRLPGIGGSGLVGLAWASALAGAWAAAVVALAPYSSERSAVMPRPFGISRGYDRWAPPSLVASGGSIAARFSVGSPKCRPSIEPSPISAGVSWAREPVSARRAAERLGGPRRRQRDDRQPEC